MKTINKRWKPLKLRAVDDKDLSIFSDCIYQSILISSEIAYDKNRKLFSLALERFTWEVADGEDYNLKQVLSVLTIYGVEQINSKNIFNNLIYNVLSISNVDNNILILLNDKKIINLKVFDWSCILEDLGTPKSPPLAPSHLRND